MATPLPPTMSELPRGVAKATRRRRHTAGEERRDGPGNICSRPRHGLKTPSSRTRTRSEGSAEVSAVVGPAVGAGRAWVAERIRAVTAAGPRLPVAVAAGGKGAAVEAARALACSGSQRPRAALVPYIASE